jgi:hypothetical protein
MLTHDKQWIKYTDELLNALEYWIKNNNVVWHSPFKDNLVSRKIERDLLIEIPSLISHKFRR